MLLSQFILYYRERFELKKRAKQGLLILAVLGCSFLHCCGWHPYAVATYNIHEGHSQLGSA